ncbi:MAG: DUF4214 domain-containing protein [Nanoarchaeota archaeon]
MSKLKVGFITSYPAAKTGFSRNIHALLPYLYNLKKYDIYLLAQSMQDNIPDFLRYPIHIEGVFKNFDQQRFEKDEGYKRHVAYGNTAVADFVVRNKLDIVVHIEDIWSSANEAYFGQPFFEHIKENFLQWSTADSLPILPNFKDWAKQVKNMWLWSSFAEKALEEEDSKIYGHIKTVHGTLNTDYFYPLSQSERWVLRQKFNIKDDEIIIIYLGRNQLRKLFWSHLEALAKIRKTHPNYKIRLLFHCFASEGWPLDRIRDEVGLEKEDMLMTYFCRQCGEWEIKPYEGEDRDCKNCGIKGGPPTQQNPNGSGQMTAAVISTISEEELNKIYNIADAACSIFTSGGQEYFNVESLLCGLPLASTPYSSGEEFTNNNFVYTIDGTFTRECGTAFKKYVPDINSVAKFFRYIYELKPQERLEIGKKGRQWALKEFDVSIIGPKLEQFLDSCKPIDWAAYEIKLKQAEKPKTPNAIIPATQDDEEYVKTLYKEILNMSVDSNDQGWNYWMTAIKNGMAKNDIELYFRKVAMDKNQNINQFNFETLLENNGKKHFLLVTKESAGDILYATSLLKSFRISYTENEWNLYLSCDSQYHELLEGCPYITKIIPYQQFMENEIFCIGNGEKKGLFQGYCFLTAQSQRFLNYLGNHNINLDLKYGKTNI